MAEPTKYPPADDGDSDGIKIAHSIPWDSSDEDLLFLQQIGLRWVQVVWGSDAPDLDRMREVQQKMASYGIRICSAGHSASSSIRLQLGQSGRDEDIETYQAFIRALGALGIPLAVYSFHPANTYTTHYVARRGYTARAFDLERFRSDVEEQKFDREYPVAEIWENYTYFMQAIQPVADEANVTMTLHPDDPPVEMMNGVGKMFTHRDGYARAEEIAGPGSKWGLLYCVGTWSEGGGEMGKDVFGMIEDFGTRGRIAEVHFRNVSSTMPYFEETFPDDGYQNMAEVMRALKRAGFKGPVLPDHIPKLVGDEDSRSGLAYCISYMRAVLREA